MNIIERSVRKYAAGLGILGLCALGISAAVKIPQTMIRNWPELPRGAARALIAEYGQPNSFDDNSLVWHKKGPWQRIVVYRKGRDILEQSIFYDVPAAKIAALKRFDRRLNFDPATGQLSSREESENRNYLALNLADEIVTGKRSPDEARAFYRKTLKLSASGKVSPYMYGFLFPLNEKSLLRKPIGKPNPTEEPYRSGLPQPTR
jgi:hypothetical protein